jgi:hypothetical protein
MGFAVLWNRLPNNLRIPCGDYFRHRLLARISHPQVRSAIALEATLGSISGPSTTDACAGATRAITRAQKAAAIIPTTFLIILPLSIFVEHHPTV